MQGPPAVLLHAGHPGGVPDAVLAWVTMALGLALLLGGLYRLYTYEPGDEGPTGPGQPEAGEGPADPGHPEAGDRADDLDRGDRADDLDRGDRADDLASADRADDPDS